MAPHFVLEDSGEKYVARKIDCAGGDQYTEEYKKTINPHSRVPVLQRDSGDWISENIAILPYLGKRFGFWSEDPVTEAKMLSFIGWVASTVHPAQAHYRRAYRSTTDKATHPNIQKVGLESFHNYLKDVDKLYAGKTYLFGNRLSVCDHYAFVLYTRGLQRGFPMKDEMPHFIAFNNEMRKRPAIHRVFEDEDIDVR